MHAKWRCDTPPPSKKGYLGDPCAIPYENKANGCDTPVCDAISKGHCAIWRGISHWAAKFLRFCDGCPSTCENWCVLCGQTAPSKASSVVLPEPVLTWYQSFCDDYMAYLNIAGRDIAGRDAVLAAQVASPGTQVTIQFVAVAIEEAEVQAKANDQTLQEFLGNMTIADLVEQFTNDQNHSWLADHDFFMGNNGKFAVVREVSEASHDFLMGDTISSDVSAMEVHSHGQPDDVSAAQPASDDEPAASAQPAAEEQPADVLGAIGLSGFPSSAPRTTTRLQIRSGKRSKISLSSSSRTKSPSWLTGFIPPMSIPTICGWIARMPRRRARGLALEFILMLDLLSLELTILMHGATGTLIDTIAFHKKAP